jgi:programmed cell death protein 5
MSDEELERIRRKRLEELNRQAIQQQNQQQQQQQQFNAQKNDIMRKLLSSDARVRLENLRMTRREFANNVEMQLIQLFQAGSLQKMTTLPMSEADFKTILSNLQKKKRDTKIRII